MNKLGKVLATLLLSGAASGATAEDFYKMGTLAPGGTIYTITAGFAQAA